jgi:hypothetical protein
VLRIIQHYSQLIIKSLIGSSTQRKNSLPTPSDFLLTFFGINPTNLFVPFSMHHLSFVTHKISHHLNIQTSPIFNKTLKSEESRRLNRQINFIISSSHSSTPNTTNNLATGPGTRPSKDTHDYEHSTVIKSKQSQTRLPISLFPNYDIPMQL